MIPSSGVRLVIKWECPESASIVRPSFFSPPQKFRHSWEVVNEDCELLGVSIRAGPGHLLSFFFLCGSWIHLKWARNFINCLPKISRAGSSGSSEKSMLKKEPHSTTPVFFTRCRFSLLVWFWEFFFNSFTLHRGPWTVRWRQKWGPKHTHEKWRADRRVNEKIIYRQMIFYLFARCVLSSSCRSVYQNVSARGEVIFLPFSLNYLWLRFFVDSRSRSHRHGIFWAEEFSSRFCFFSTFCLNSLITHMSWIAWSGTAKENINSRILWAVLDISWNSSAYMYICIYRRLLSVHLLIQ